MFTFITYDPWIDLASRPYITAGFTDLPGGAGGLWFPDLQAIAIDRQLGRIGMRCVLAHELAHIDLRHGPCAGNGPGTLRIAHQQERHATRLAAQRLLPTSLIAAKYAEDVYLADMADDLDVTEALLDLRLRSLTDDERVLLPARRCAA